MSRLASPLIAAFLFAATAQAGNVTAAMQRMEADFAAGRPLVAHVVVALADNEHQGIVPVPAALGNGADPRSNLYWGAMYGVRTYFRRSADWHSTPVTPANAAPVLDRVAFRRELIRDGRRGAAVIVAEAWRGDRIADAIRHFFELDRGRVQSMRVGEKTIEAG